MQSRPACPQNLLEQTLSSSSRWLLRLPKISRPSMSSSRPIVNLLRNLRSSKAMLSTSPLLRKCQDPSPMQKMIFMTQMRRANLQYCSTVRHIHAICPSSCTCPCPCSQLSAKVDSSVVCMLRIFTMLHFHHMFKYYMISETIYCCNSKH